MGSGVINRGRVHCLAAFLWLIVFLIGCQSSRQTIEGIAQSVPGQQAVTTAPTMVATSLVPSATLVAPLSITGETASPPVVAPAIPTPIPTTYMATNELIATTPTSETQVQPTETPIPPTFTPPPPPPLAEGEHFWFQRPVPTSGVAWTDKTYPYGNTRGGTLRPHTGVEFQVPLGTPVLAVSDGIVRVAGSDNMIAYGPQLDYYGNLVIIEARSKSNDKPVYHLYGHLSEVNVVEGQTIASGEQIGLSGESGIADGPHLHFEVRVGENNYTATRNPLLWLSPFPQTGIVIGRVLWPNGEVAVEVPVTLIRVDAPSPYTATTSYASGEPNPDDTFAENFAIDDVAPGYYQVIVGAGENRRTTEMWVFPGRTNFIEVVLDN